MSSAKPKSNSVITTEVSTDSIKFNVLGAGSVVLDLGLLNPEVYKLAAIHGLKQRIADASALSRDTETGLPASPQEKLAALTELVEHYNSGSSEWSLKRTGSGTQEGGLLVQALSRVFPQKELSRIREYVKALSVKERNALMASNSVAPHVAELRAEATKGINVEELIAGL